MSLRKSDFVFQLANDTESQILGFWKLFVNSVHNNLLNPFSSSKMDHYTQDCLCEDPDRVDNWIQCEQCNATTNTDLKFKPRS